jgi:radical SAM superfamily enzyme YgiQ (UPF0313 family)
VLQPELTGYVSYLRMGTMILIHPPVAKACEPPAGIARLAGFLNANGVDCLLLDLNLEATLHLLETRVAQSDTWTKRAVRNVSRNLNALRDWRLFQNPDRYRRAVMDLNRILTAHGQEAAFRLSLSDYQHETLSPLRSEDLLWSAEHPDADPFYSSFSGRLRGVAGEIADGVIGFSLNYLSQALPTFSMLGFLRREFPSARLVLGGGLVTSWLQRPGWKNRFAGLVDEIVSGPGEYPLLRILGKSPISSGGALPRFSGLPLREYLSPGLILPYATSSGCYWGRCSFCPERAEGNQYCPVAPDLVLTELRRLAAEMKPALVHLVDNAISPALMERMASPEGLVHAGQIADDRPATPWYGFARITPHLTDPEFCGNLTASGCVMLKLGLESADQDVLNAMQKGHDVETGRLALAALKKAGISTYVYLLFGTPQETEASARATMEFVVQEAERIDFLNLALFNLPIASPDTPLLATRPFSDGDLSLYTDFVHPAGWERRRVRQFLESEFRRHPAVQKILRNHPLFFTSNHAPLFAMKADRFA